MADKTQICCFLMYSQKWRYQPNNIQESLLKLELKKNQRQQI